MNIQGSVPADASRQHAQPSPGSLPQARLTDSSPQGLRRTLSTVFSAETLEETGNDRARVSPGRRRRLGTFASWLLGSLAESTRNHHLRPFTSGVVR